MRLCKFAFLPLTSVCVAFISSSCSVIKPTPTFEQCKISFNKNLENFKNFVKTDLYNHQFSDLNERSFAVFSKLVDFQKVIDDCMPSAVSNNPEAQYYVGYSYNKLDHYYVRFYNNKVLSEDEYLKLNSNSSAEYFKWISKSAGLGYVKALAELGKIYRFGVDDAHGNKFISSDWPKAVEYFSKAASHDDITGITYLAESYRNGIGVKQNYAEAYKLFKKGYELNDPECTYRLGRFTLLGQGTEFNYEEGKKLLEKATEMPFDYTCDYCFLGYTHMLGYEYEEGLLIRRYDDKSRKDYRKKALHYYQLSCDRGFGFSCEVLKRKKKQYRYIFN